MGYPQSHPGHTHRSPPDRRPTGLLRHPSLVGYTEQDTPFTPGCRVSAHGPVKARAGARWLSALHTGCYGRVFIGHSWSLWSVRDGALLLIVVMHRYSGRQSVIAED